MQSQVKVENKKANDNKNVALALKNLVLIIYTKKLASFLIFVSAGQDHQFDLRDQAGHNQCYFFGSHVCQFCGGIFLVTASGSGKLDSKFFSINGFNRKMLVFIL